MELSNQKYRPKTQKCFLRRATNVTFSKFRRWRRKQKNRASHGFLKLRFARFELIYQFELKRGQRFWEVVYFTVQNTHDYIWWDEILDQLLFFFNLFFFRKKTGNPIEGHFTTVKINNI